MPHLSLPPLLWLAACGGGGETDGPTDPGEGTSETATPADTAAAPTDTAPGPLAACPDEATLVEAAAAVLRGQDDEQVGTTIAFAGDLDGDGDDDLLVPVDHGDAGGGEDAGAVYLFTGDGLPATLDDAVAVITGVGAGDQLGVGAAGLGDVDGDGHGDLLLGAPFASDGAAYSGAAYVLHGPFAGERSAATANAVLSTTIPDVSLARVAAAGDLDGDGHGDLAVGGIGGGGRVFVLHGPATGRVWLEDDAAADVLGDPDESVARVVGGGDLDGDGLDDLLVGSERADHGGEDAGAVYVLHGPAEVGTVDTAALPARLDGDAGTIAGHGVTGLGDWDGDGRDDLAVGGPYADDKAGRVWIVTDDVVGPTALSTTPDVLLGEAEGDRAGFSVAAPGDVDGDGWPDLLVGAKFLDEAGEDAGVAYLIFGPTTGVQSVADAAGLRLLGEAERDHAGTVGRVGDLDGDGHPELGVGARRQGEEDAGALYLIRCGL